MLLKSPYKINDMLQTLSNGKKVFDFQKIRSLGFPIHLIMTERGSKGKTTNSKELIRKDFINLKQPSIWMYNTITMGHKAKEEFLMDMRKSFVRKNINTNFWDHAKITGNPDTATMKAKDRHNEPFIQFIALSQAESMKGSRLPYKNLIWDEFNVNFNRVQKPVEKFDSLLHSLEDLVSGHKEEQGLRLFIFGNNKSINNPIIYKLGVTHIDDEISELYDENGNKLMLIIQPHFSKKDIVQIEDDNKNNWIFQTSKQMGQHKHSYYNETLHDITNNIVQYTLSKEKSALLLPQITIYHKEEYYNLYKTRDTKIFHIVKVDKEDIWKTVIITLNNKDIVENAKINITIKRQLKNAIANNNVSFEDIASREIFISSITY